MLITFLFIISNFFWSADASDLNAKTLENFRPEYSADQSVVTSDMLSFEEYQFSLLAQWHAVIDQLESAKMKSAFLKKEFGRAERLVKTNGISQEAYIVAKFMFESSKNDVVRYQADVDKTSASTMLAKLQLQAEVSPGEDYRRAITEARIKVYKANLAALHAQLATVDTEKSLLDVKVANSKKLLKANAISEKEFDLCDYNQKATAQKVVALKAQISVTELAIEALEKTLAKLP